LTAVRRPKKQRENVAAGWKILPVYHVKPHADRIRRSYNRHVYFSFPGMKTTIYRLVASAGHA
jgi:hypothetical protein